MTKAILLILSFVFLIFGLLKHLLSHQGWDIQGPLDTFCVKLLVFVK